MTGRPALGASPLGAYLLGVACIVAGGLVAAVSSPLHLATGPWAAAYLVLVCGCAQCLFVVARQPLGLPTRSPRGFALQFGCWNVGNAAVLAGTLLRVPALVDVGGALLVITLAIELWQARARSTFHPVLLWAYRLVLAALLVSIPVGLVLATVRAAA
ncbi:MAG: hypothetical protein ACTHJL_09705 [Amnibacterium sp.]